MSLTRVKEPELQNFIILLQKPEKSDDKYYFNLHVYTRLDPVELDGNVRGLLREMNAWLKHPAIDYEKDAVVGYLIFTKEGIHSTKKWKESIEVEAKKVFDISESKIELPYPIRRQVDKWDSKFLEPRVSVVFETVHGKDVSAEMMVIKVPSLHYASMLHMLNMLANDGFFGRYSLCTKRTKADLQRRRVNKSFANDFDAKLALHKLMVENLYVITLKNVPDNFANIQLRVEEDGLPKDAVLINLG